MPKASRRGGLMMHETSGRALAVLGLAMARDECVALGGAFTADSWDWRPMEERAHGHVLELLDVLDTADRQPTETGARRR